MVAAMAAFAVEDALVKAVAAVIPLGWILIAFGTLGAAGSGLIAALRGETLFGAALASGAMRARFVFEIAGRLFYGLAITLTPLASATVILQAAPIVVVAGAALIFGERVGWRRWSAIAVGLAGVLVILQPGLEGFSALSLLALGGMLGFAGRDLASRAAPAAISAVALGFHGFVCVALAGVLIATWSGAPFAAPDAATATRLLAATAVGAGAYACLMRAMRTGSVSAVAPFRYTRLLFGSALGVVVFGEAVTLPMLVGSAMVVAAGLALIRRGARR